MNLLTQPPPRPVPVASQRHYAFEHRPPDWTAGLTTRTANALRAFGLRSRAEVVALPQRRLKCIPNLGSVSLKDLQRWLTGSASTHKTISKKTR